MGVVSLCRYLDPDSAALLAEMSQTTNKKFHKLNKAVTTLVSEQYKSHTIKYYVKIQFADEKLRRRYVGLLCSIAWVVEIYMYS